MDRTTNENDENDENKPETKSTDAKSEATEEKAPVETQGNEAEDTEGKPKKAKKSKKEKGQVNLKLSVEKCADRRVRLIVEDGESEPFVFLSAVDPTNKNLADGLVDAAVSVARHHAQPFCVAMESIAGALFRCALEGAK